MARKRSDVRTLKYSLISYESMSSPINAHKLTTCVEYWIMWGNPKLVSWDYGKEITLTLEDALISFESLRIMLGGKINKASADKKVKVHLTEQATIAATNTIPTLYDHLNASITYDLSNVEFRYINLTTGKRGKQTYDSTTKTMKGFEAVAGNTVRFFWTQEVDNEDKAVEITISPNTFPGS